MIQSTRKALCHDCSAAVVDQKSKREVKFMARDPQGRFVRAQEEEEEAFEPEAEPEAEPAGAELAAGQAALLAAIVGRIEASERR